MMVNITCNTIVVSNDNEVLFYMQSIVIHSVFFLAYFTFELCSCAGYSSGCDLNNSVV